MNKSRPAVVSKSRPAKATRARICLVHPWFPIFTQKDAKLAVNYNYSYYNLPLSHIMIIARILDEDMLSLKQEKLRLSFLNMFPVFLIL